MPTIWRSKMRAIVLEKFGGLDSLVYEEIPDPEPKPGHVVIEIKAFGINHAELHMRRGEWAEAAKVSGIECVGLVKSAPGGEFTFLVAIYLPALRPTWCARVSELGHRARSGQRPMIAPKAKQPASPQIAAGITAEDCRRE